MPDPLNNTPHDAENTDLGRRVLDVEIVNEGTRDSGSAYGNTSRRAHGSRGGAFDGVRFTQVWFSNYLGRNACLAPCITFALFLVCLVQFGFLAGIGFLFFCTLGSVAGTFWSIRQVVRNKLPNPWLWKMANWMASFTLTAWLAGGLD